MRSGIGRMMTDEIRGNRIGVMSFLASFTASSLKARSCLIAPSSRGPFYCSSVVVNRSPVHARKERNALKAGPGASALPRGNDLLSSAPTRTSYGATALSLIRSTAQPEEGSGWEKKDEACLEFNRWGRDENALFRKLFRRHFERPL